MSSPADNVFQVVLKKNCIRFAAVLSLEKCSQSYSGFSVFRRKLSYSLVETYGQV